MMALVQKTNRMILRGFIFFILILSMTKCTPTTKEDEKKVDHTESDTISRVFKYSNIRFINEDTLSKDYNKSSREFNLIKLSQKQRGLLTDHLFGKATAYVAYFYAIQPKVKTTQPILIYASAVDFGSILLLTVAENGELIDHLKLTANNGDVIDRKGDREIVSGNQRYSEFLNDSTIRMTDLKIMIDGYGKKGETKTTDSLTIEYAIKDNGLIRQVKKDSVRYSKITK